MRATSRARRRWKISSDTRAGIERYVAYMRQQGFYAEAHFARGHGRGGGGGEAVRSHRARFPHAQFFAGQLVFKDESLLTRWLHNYTVFELQRRLYQQGWPMLILPIRV